jgi:hypothetical protein
MMTPFDDDAVPAAKHLSMLVIAIAVLSVRTSTRWPPVAKRSQLRRGVPKRVGILVLDSGGHGIVDVLRPRLATPCVTVPPREDLQPRLSGGRIFACG